MPRNNSKERFELLLGKGVFPYEYADTIEDFDCTKLIEKKYFYNSITRSSITDEQYEKAKHVWKTLEMGSMKDFMETYCLCDTLLLCESLKDLRMKAWKILKLNLVIL